MSKKKIGWRKSGVRVVDRGGGGGWEWRSELREHRKSLCVEQRRVVLNDCNGDI